MFRCMTTERSTVRDSTSNEKLCYARLMTSMTDRSFGLLIAYLIPGFIAINALRFVSPQVTAWLGTGLAQDAPTLAGFLYVTLTSIFAGLVASTLRWLLVDSLLQLLGIRQPQWNLQRLGERVSAFTMLIDIHYRYYQFYGNSFIAITFFLAIHWTQGQGTSLQFVFGPVMLVLLFLGACDTLRKYYKRVDDCLSDIRASDL